MKKLLTALALTTVVASPALAASARYHRYPSQDPYAAHATYQGRDGVIIENRYREWDPDANIRLEERRDALTGHE